MAPEGAIPLPEEAPVSAGSGALIFHKEKYFPI